MAECRHLHIRNCALRLSSVARTHFTGPQSLAPLSPSLAPKLRSPRPPPPGAIRRKEGKKEVPYAGEVQCTPVQGGRREGSNCVAQSKRNSSNSSGACCKKSDVLKIGRFENRTFREILRFENRTFQKCTKRLQKIGRFGNETSDSVYSSTACCKKSDVLETSNSVVVQG